MKRIGLTGGIGSGKSTVARLIQARQIPVYYADDRAKQLSKAHSVQQQLSALFALPRLDHGCVSSAELARLVFSSSSALAQLNALIHPLVESDFKSWCQTHSSAPLVVMEAALIYEAHFETLFDAIVCVYAPQELCLERVQKRDGLSPEAVWKRMNMQLDPEIKKTRADHVILNDGQHDLEQEVERMLRALVA